MKKGVIVEIVCFLFILLFVYAGLTKLFDYEKFRVQIGQSPLLTSFSGFIAWFIPSIEIVVSVMLALPRFRATGLYIAFTLMVLFTGYIIAILNFNGHVPCSCGGVLEKMGWTEHLVFNIVFMLFSVIGILFHSKEENKEAVMAK
jgi:uncharacterized membrane protein YphA (DoxX/SURF4 family)